MTLNEIISQNQNLIEIGKALVLIVLGILIGFIIKHLLRKNVDNFVLKKLFKKDINVYETSFTITKILTEIVQWIIIISFINFSLSLFNINFISNAMRFIISEIPKIVIFAVILSIGIILSKIISSNIKSREVKNKEEISLITEVVVISAFILTALEYIGIKATALVELYKAILYIIGAVIVIFLIKYELFKDKNEKKKN